MHDVAGSRARTAMYNTNLPELWTIEDLASYLKVSVKTVRDWRLRGAAPRALKLGRHVRFRPEDVEEWLTMRESA